MTIQIDSLQSICVFLLSAVAVFTLAATLHWKLFAAPLLRKMMEPMGLGITVATRVIRQKYPDEYEKAERELIRDIQLRGTP